MSVIRWPESFNEQGSPDEGESVRRMSVSGGSWHAIAKKFEVVSRAGC